ncbi:MAG: PAS domain S-box protein [Potamolinea sp.]
MIPQARCLRYYKAPTSPNIRGFIIVSKTLAMMQQELRTVLIVEDSTEDRETYRRYLLKDQRYSYQILETESGKKGLQLCLTTKPDVILLDYFLPDLDGLEFLAELNTRNQQTDLPVIMLTGQGNESVAVAAMKNGAADYLIKRQITPEILNHTVHSVLERKHLSPQLAQSQERQKLTATIALSIRQFLNLDDILNTTVTQVQQLLKCDRVVIYQFATDMSGKIVAESVATGWSSTLNTQIIDTCFQRGAGEDYRQGKKRAIANIYEAGLSDCHIQLLEQFQIKANLVVPILLRTQNADLSPNPSPKRRGESDSPLPSEGRGAGGVRSVEESQLRRGESDSPLPSEGRGAGGVRSVEKSQLRRGESDSPLPSEGREAGGVRSVEESQLWGLLIAHQCSDFRQWHNEQLNLLDELAVQIEISLQKSQLFHQLQQEIENYKQTEQLQKKQKQVLEMIATGASLSQILDTLARNLEKHSKEMLCSILLVDTNGKKLRHGAAPSLSEDYNQTVDGIAIAYGVGSCGTAAYLGQPVIVSDIANDPLWTNFRDLALSYNLAACWSWPILSSSGKILGTLAIYYRQPRTPTTKDLQLIEASAHMAAIAIEQTLAKAALKKSEQHYKILAEMSPVGIFNTDAQGNCLYVNQEWCSIAGFTQQEALGTGWSNAIHPDDRERVFKEWYQAALNNLPFSSEYRFQNHQGVTTWVLGKATAVRSDNQEIIGYVGTITDISDRKEIESELEQRVLERTVQLLTSEVKFRAIFNQTFQFISLLEVDGTIIEINQTALDFGGVSLADCVGKPLWETPWWRISTQTQEQLKQAIAQAASGSFIRYEVDVQGAKGQVITLDFSLKPIKDETGQVILLIPEGRDISERKVLEQELASREKLLNAFFEAAACANVGLCIHDEELRFIQLNQTLAEINGSSIEEHLGKTLTEVIPDIAPFVAPILKQVQTTGKPILNREISTDTPQLPGVKRDWLISYFPIFEDESKVVAVGVILTEITERKQAEEKIKAANIDLARSNQELENFAYVASHDLQEPLRKIKSFTELLAGDYRGQLNENADKYINYITDGTSRMQALINDLLTYSRVGRIELNKQPTDLNLVLDEVQTDLSVVIAENNAIITTTPLPTVQANPVQMAQLFQNLIANSIKFRTETSPKIQINAQLQQEKWLISIQDNGIGIKPEYSERIFVIFQRLHNRSKYPGTGIGLAICRKIVERHGGEIWMKSELGKGTIFYLTLPI